MVLPSETQIIVNFSSKNDNIHTDTYPKDL